MTSLPQQLRSIPISEVYHVLTGREVRRAGDRKWRAAALWRGGDGLSVAGDDAMGVWMDFVTNEGGGLLDLVAAIRGGTRREAYQWLADWAGVPSPEKGPDAAQRARWLHEQQQVKRLLSTALYWRRGIIALTSELLDELKAKLLKPLLKDLDLEFGEIYRFERILWHLRRLDGADLVGEYLSWRKSHPDLTGWLVKWSEEQQAAERAALIEEILGGG